MTRTEAKAQVVEAALVTHSIDRQDVLPDENGEVDVKTRCGLFFKGPVGIFVPAHEATCQRCKAAWVAWMEHWA